MIRHSPMTRHCTMIRHCSMIRPAALTLLLAASVYAASPVLTELKPRGAEIGRPFTLTLLGRNLPEAAPIASPLPAAFTQVMPSQKPGTMAAAGRTVAFLVEP